MHWIAQVSRDVIVDFIALVVLLVVFGGSFILGFVRGVATGRKWEKADIDQTIAKKLGVNL